MEKKFVLVGKTYKNDKYVATSIGACSDTEKDLEDLVYQVAESHDTEVFHTDMGMCYKYDGHVFVCNVEKVPYLKNENKQEEHTWDYCPKEDIAICSKCGYEHYLGTYREYATNYCPHCGSKMKPVR